MLCVVGTGTAVCAGALADVGAADESLQDITIKEMDTSRKRKRFTATPGMRCININGTDSRSVTTKCMEILVFKISYA